MNERNIDTILAKLFSREQLSEQERDEIQAWKNDNEAEYKIIEKIYNETSNSSDNVKFDVDAAWQKINKITNKAKVVSIRKNYWQWAVAAAVLLIIAGVYFFNSGSKANNHLQLAQTDNTGPKTISLPDGSTVILNKNSSLEYDSTMQDERIVTLSGEAFFDVKHDDSKPFTVKANNATVKVLGTAFNIKTNANATKVNVERGSVELSANHQKAILNAGEKGVFQDAKVIKSISKDQNYLAWKNKKLVFRESDFNEVITSLEDYYNVKIHINDDKAVNCKVTTTFSSETITEALEELKLLLHFNYEKNAERIIISNTDCQ